MATPPCTALEGSPASALDRRESARQTCKLEICFGSAPTDRPVCTAVVRDLSAGGIGLLVNEPISRGTLVTIRLFSEADGIVFSKSLRVKYAHSEAAGGWAIGGSFDKDLTKKEMKLLLNETE